MDNLRQTIIVLLLIIIIGAITGFILLNDNYCEMVKSYLSITQVPARCLNP